MIEEREKDLIAAEPLSLGYWAKDIEPRQLEEAPQRRFHSAVVHKSSLYIYGGLLREEQLDPQGEQAMLYRYNFGSRVWTRLQTHFLSNAWFSFIYGHSTAVYNNMMYLFGGRSNEDKQYIQGLWCLNLESYNWKRQELKGYSPLPRQFSTMVLHQRSSIVLYGGRHQGEFLNDFHIYRIENKAWLSVEENSYDLKIPCRLRPALCSQGDHLYLFGGERMVVNGNRKIHSRLSDFYQVKIINRPMSSKPDLWVKTIITGASPPEQLGSLLNLHDKYLLLWTGGPGFWLYSIPDITWHWVQAKGVPRQLPQAGWSANFAADKLLLFGEYGPSAQSGVASGQSSGLTVLTIEHKQIESRLLQPDRRPKYHLEAGTGCWECNEQRHALTQNRSNTFQILEEALSEELSFPFAALALLLDNAVLVGAREARVVFGHTFKEKYCLVEDNGSTSKMWPNWAEFVHDMVVVRTYVEENIDQLQEEDHDDKAAPQHAVSHPPANIMNTKETKEQKEQKERQAKDKEMERELKKRKRQAKVNAKRRKEDRIEYSRNLKLGGLRLGTRLLFVTRYGSSLDNRRVLAIEREKGSNGGYRAHYYVYENGAVTEAGMETARRYIDQEFQVYFKLVNERKEHANNFVFMAGLSERPNEKGDLQPELKESPRHNDVFCCQRALLDSLDESILLDSIDLSLKNYLSVLYLKSDDFKISLSINDQRTVQISNSELFDKIDSLVKSERLIDLMPALDLSHCNIIEVYYNKTSGRARELNRKTSMFNFLNGVLFYRKNRLVARYRFPLGQANRLLKFKVKVIQQALMMFGFIEIKAEFAVNLFKTAFVRDDLLEEIHHRLKFIEKYAEERLSRDKEDSSHQRRPPDQRTESRKRFRHNEEEQMHQE